MATMAKTRAPAALATPEDMAQAETAVAPQREALQQFQTDESRLMGDVRRTEEEALKSKEARDIAVKEAEATQLGLSAEQQRGLTEKTQREIEKNPFPTFKPSQEDAVSYSQLGSLVGTLGMMLGSGAKGSAKVAIGAMTGMMKGWQSGRKELWDREVKVFDKEVQRIKAVHGSIYKDLDLGLKQLATDREAGRAKLMSAAWKAGTGSVIATLINNGRAQDALKVVRDGYKLSSDIDKRVQDIAIAQRRHEEAQQLRREQIAARTTEKTQKATQQQFIVQRAVNALGGVQSALETIVELPQGATTGWLPNLQTKDGMVNAVRNQLGRKISSVDAEFMNTLFSGIGRNLASIEASGTATGLTGLANQLQSGVYINAGVDDPFKVAMKLADIRRIATENIRPSINSGLMPPQQAEEAQRLVEKIEKIIPYTTLDVANAYRQAKGGARPTIRESTGRAMQPSESSWTSQDEARLKELEEKANATK